MAATSFRAPVPEAITLTSEDIKVIRNWGGAVAAKVREPNGQTFDWVLGMDAALNAGCEIPPRPEVVAWQPQLNESAGEVAAAMRIPFYRRMSLPKRGRKRRRS